MTVVPALDGFEVWYRGGHLDHELKGPHATFKTAAVANRYASRLARSIGRIAVHAGGARDV